MLAVAVPDGDAVRIQLLGTGHPDISADKPRMQSAITVDVGGDRWLLDVGAGSVARLGSGPMRRKKGRSQRPLNLWGPDGL